MALTAGASALVAALVGAAAQAAPAAPVPAAAASDGQPLITVEPGVIHPSGRLAAPSPLNCEKQYHVICYLPAQLQAAYNLPRCTPAASPARARRS